MSNPFEEQLPDAELIEFPQNNDMLFLSGSDWQFNACVDFKYQKASRELAYLDGYTAAADALYHQVRMKPYMVDRVVYPMVFLYRHYVELSLKAIIFWGSRVLENPSSPGRIHSLDTLWQQAKSIMEERWPEDDVEIINNAERLILQLDKVDPKSTVFRYAPDVTINPNPAVTDETRELSHINIRQLRDVMNRLSNFLDGVLTQFHVDWDQMCEARFVEQEIQLELEAEWRRAIFDAGYPDAPGSLEEGL